jgi:hypothetical protein
VLEEVNQRLQFKSRAGCACPQEGLLAKKVAHTLLEEVNQRLLNIRVG